MKFYKSWKTYSWVYPGHNCSCISTSCALNYIVDWKLHSKLSAHTVFGSPKINLPANVRNRSGPNLKFGVHAHVSGWQLSRNFGRSAQWGYVGSNDSHAAGVFRNKPLLKSSWQTATCYNDTPNKLPRRTALHCITEHEALARRPSIQPNITQV